MLLTNEDNSNTSLIWRRFRSDLFRFVRRRVRDDAVADDLLQDTFERIHRGIDQLSDQKRVAAWVHTIVRNVLADHYRKERSTEPLPEMLEELKESENEDNRRIGGWLLGMVNELPDDYRSAIHMVEVEGLTQTETASRLGLSVSGAKSRVQRGRKLLRQALATCCHVEFDRRGNVVEYEPRNGCC